MVRTGWPGWLLGVMLGAGQVVAQEPAAPPRVELRENVPNPFFPSTTIPFVIYPEVCARGHEPLVSLKIYNVLAQVIAIPVLQGLPASSWTTYGCKCDVVCGVLGWEAAGRQKRGHSRHLLLPAGRGWPAHHSQDDRAALRPPAGRAPSAVSPFPARGAGAAVIQAGWGGTAVAHGARRPIQTEISG